MASTDTPLGIEKQATGENAGTWGTKTNTNLEIIEQLAGGTIGSRPEGMVEFGSNYYTLLGDNSIVLKKKMTIQNTSSSSELWKSLQSEYDLGESGSAQWWVYGTVYFNLSSMTSGQENTVPFEFFR